MPGAARPRWVRLMGGTSSLTAGRRYRRARRLRHDREGVVAVIGTLLSLLVFFALFGIFLTQYVPLWMTDNESQFTSQTETSFADFKSNIDAQYTLGGPQSYGTPFVISSQGVPLIAQPTQGSLAFLPSTCAAGLITTKGSAYYGQPVNPDYCVFVNVTLSVGPGGSGTYSDQILTGSLYMQLPNRYYSPELFYFEDDGVIEGQAPGGYEIMQVPPPLNITKVGGNTSVSDSVVQLYGNSSSVIGQGTEEVYSQLRYTQTVMSNGVESSGTFTPFTFTYVIGTQYPCAWDPFLYKVVTTSGISAANYALTTNFDGIATTPLTAAWASSCVNPTQATTLLSFSLTSVNYAKLYLGGFQLDLGVGSV